MKLLPQAGNNSFVSNSFFIFLVRFFPSLANVLVIIFFSHKLNKTDYGIYQDFWVQLFVFSTIACLGFQAFIITYKPAVIAGLIKRFKLNYYIAFAAWMLVIAIVFGFFQRQHFGVMMPLFFLLVYTLSVITESLLIAFRNFRSIATLNILYSVAFCYLHWLFIAAGGSFMQLFATILLLGIIKLAVSVFVVVKEVSTQPVADEGYDMARIRNLWVHMGVYDVLQTVFRWLDKFVVALFLSKELFAIYFNGSLEIPFLPLLLGAAGSAAVMHLSGVKETGSSESTLQLLHRSGKLLSSVVFPLFFFFIVFRREIFEVVLSAQYLPAVPVFLISVLSMPLKAYSFTTVLQNRHKGNTINTGAVLDMIIACALMYPLYKWLGLPGIALAFVVSTYFQAAFYLYHTSGELGIPAMKLLPLANWAIKFIVFALLFIGFHYLASGYFTNKINLFLGGGLVMVTVVISLLLQIRSEKYVHGSVAQK